MTKVVKANSRAAVRAGRKGELLSSSDVDEVYRMQDGSIVVVLLTAVYRRKGYRS